MQQLRYAMAGNAYSTNSMFYRTWFGLGFLGVLLITLWIWFLIFYFGHHHHHDHNGSGGDVTSICGADVDCDSQSNHTILLYNNVTNEHIYIDPDDICPEACQDGINGIDGDAGINGINGINGNNGNNGTDGIDGDDGMIDTCEKPLGSMVWAEGNLTEDIYLAVLVPMAGQWNPIDDPLCRAVVAKNLTYLGNCSWEIELNQTYIFDTSMSFKIDSPNATEIGLGLSIDGADPTNDHQKSSHGIHAGSVDFETTALLVQGQIVSLSVMNVLGTEPIQIENLHLDIVANLMCTFELQGQLCDLLGATSLDCMSDVNLTDLQDGDILVYDNVTQQFENQNTFPLEQVVAGCSASPPCDCENDASCQGTLYLCPTDGSMYSCDCGGSGLWTSISEFERFGEEVLACQPGDTILDDRNCNVDWGDSLGGSVENSGPPESGLYVPKDFVIGRVGFASYDPSCQQGGTFDVDICWTENSTSLVYDVSRCVTMLANLTDTKTASANDLEILVPGDRYITWGISSSCQGGGSTSFVLAWNVNFYYRWVLPAV